MKNRLLVLLLGFTLLLSACQRAALPADGPPSTSSEPKILRIFQSADASTLNLHQALSTAENSAAGYLMGGLYRTVIVPDVGEKQVPELALAEPKQMDDLGKVWRIEVSPKAVWENGEPMNADTFMYSWKMQLDPKLLNTSANTFYQYSIDILNAEAYYNQGQEGKSPVAWEDVGLKKIDDMTLEITTTQRYNASEVMSHFSIKSSKPVYEPWYEKYMNESRTATTYGTEEDRLMCSGPFVLESWVRDSEQVYKKNPLSPIADMIKLDGIKISVVGDSGTAMQLFLAGELDIIELTGAQIDEYQEDPRAREYPSRSVYHLDINSGNIDNPLLGNQNFRKALYWAIDRNTLAQLIKQNPAPYYLHHLAGGYPDDNIVYRDLPEAKALVNPNGGYDPEKARDYLAKAVAEVGITGKATVNLMYSDSGATMKTVCEYLQKQIPEALGKDNFEMTLSAVPSSTFSPTKRAWRTDPNSYELATGSWNNSSTLTFPNTQFRYFTSGYSSKSTPFVSERLDELFDLSLTEEYRLDRTKLMAATLEMEEIFLNEVIAIPLYESVNRTMFSERIVLPVKQYVPGTGWGYMYSDIDLSK